MIFKKLEEWADTLANEQREKHNKDKNWWEPIIHSQEETDSSDIPSRFNFLCDHLGDAQEAMERMYLEIINLKAEQKIGNLSQAVQLLEAVKTMIDKLSQEAAAKTCNFCNGTGVEEEVANEPEFNLKCDNCDGTGEIQNVPSRKMLEQVLKNQNEIIDKAIGKIYEKKNE